MVSESCAIHDHRITRLSISRGPSSSENHRLVNPSAVAPQLALRLSCRPFHPASQAHRPHIRPHFFDIGQAIGLGAGLACIAPAQCIEFMSRPDRILFFVIHYDFIDSIVVVFAHGFYVTSIVKNPQKNWFSCSFALTVLQVLSSLSLAGTMTW
jgi:hypothetical protein